MNERIKKILWSVDMSSRTTEEAEAKLRRILPVVIEQEAARWDEDPETYRRAVALQIKKEWGYDISPVIK